MARQTLAKDGTIPSDLPTYSVGQVAAILGCDKTTVRRMADEGRIAAFRLRGRGSERRISRAAMIEYLIHSNARGVLKQFFGMDMPADPGPTLDELRRRQESLARISRRARPPHDDV